MNENAADLRDVVGGDEAKGTYKGADQGKLPPGFHTHKGCNRPPPLARPFCEDAPGPRSDGEERGMRAAVSQG